MNTQAHQTLPIDPQRRSRLVCDDLLGTCSLADMLKAISKKGAVRLDGEAAFYAAICAGVPTKVAGGTAEKITLETAYPVDVWIDGGQIKVYTKVPNV